MYKIKTTNQFEKDLKRAAKQKLPINEVWKIATLLANDKPLDAKYKDHPLKGEYIGCRECHIKPDWLLIYKKEKETLTILFLRAGSHSELF